MARTARLLIVPLLLLGSGCTEAGEAGGRHSFDITTEDGIRVAENSGRPRYPGELFTYTEVLRLNQDESNPESLLAYPGLVITDEAGSFYVEDARDNRLVKFDATGNYLRTIGRQGAGPGEYRSVSLECIHNGILVITDTQLNRVSFFRTDGSFVDSSPLPDHGRLQIQQFHLGPDDEWILLGDIQRVDEDQNRLNTAVAMVFSAEGDSMASLSSGEIHIAKNLRLEQFNMLEIAVRYFSLSPTVLYHENHGLVLSSGLEPVMQCFDLQGRLQKVIRMNLPPEPVTKAERRAIQKYHQDWILDAEDEQSRITRQNMFELVDYQDPKACFSISHIDEYGYLWADLPYTGLSNDLFNRGGNAGCMLFSPEGEYLGNTVFPTPHAMFTRGRLTCVQDNAETGAKEVVVYALDPIPEGFVYP
ncbi:6-bladed beta-propeller [Gemmatimonadota bacterium]